MGICAHLKDALVVMEKVCLSSFSCQAVYPAEARDSAVGLA